MGDLIVAHFGVCHPAAMLLLQNLPLGHDPCDSSDNRASAAPVDRHGHEDEGAMGRPPNLPSPTKYVAPCACQPMAKVPSLIFHLLVVSRNHQLGAATA